MRIRYDSGAVLEIPKLKPGDGLLALAVCTTCGLGLADTGGMEEHAKVDCDGQDARGAIRVSVKPW